MKTKLPDYKITVCKNWWKIVCENNGQTILTSEVHEGSSGKSHAFRSAKKFSDWVNAGNQIEIEDRT